MAALAPRPGPVRRFSRQLGEVPVRWLAGAAPTVHRPSEPMSGPVLVMLFRCSLATSPTMPQISRSL